MLGSLEGINNQFSLIGAPNAGKGTLGLRIAKELKISYLSTGEEFRRRADEGQSLFVRIRDEFWSKGLLSPDEVTISLVKKILSEPSYMGGFLLDGFPRNVAQTRALDVFAPGHIPVFLETLEDTLLQRALGRRICKPCNLTYGASFHIPKKEDICDSCENPLIRRKDDSFEVFQNRLRVYREMEESLLDYYGNERSIILDANQNPEEVYNDFILQLL